MIRSRDEYIAAIVKADALCQYDDLMAMFDSILVVKDKNITKKQ